MAPLAAADAAEEKEAAKEAGVAAGAEGMAPPEGAAAVAGDDAVMAELHARAAAQAAQELGLSPLAVMPHLPPELQTTAPGAFATSTLTHPAPPAPPPQSHFSPPRREHVPSLATAARARAPSTYHTVEARAGHPFLSFSRFPPATPCA